MREMGLIVDSIREVMLSSEIGKSSTNMLLFFCVTMRVEPAIGRYFLDVLLFCMIVMITIILTAFGVFRRPPWKRAILQTNSPCTGQRFGERSCGERFWERLPLERLCV